MRLIDADNMRQDWLENGENEYVYDTNAVLDSIDAQPTVDAVPVVHAYWATEREDVYWGCSLKRKYCSNCKKRPHYDRAAGAYILTGFCPNCGAKMDGERRSGDD